MSKFTNIEEVSNALNDLARTTNFFDEDSSKIDKEANNFVENFAKEYGLEVHTVTPSRWRFDATNGSFQDGEVELQPLVEHAKIELHPKAKKKQVEFVAVKVKDAKLTSQDN